MKKIIYSAPAKVILAGEHAVVDGQPGLITAIDKHLIFTLFTSPEKKIDENILWVEKIVQDYLVSEKIEFNYSNYNCEINSDIPLGRGLGSSAAFSVAATAAFLDFFTGKQFSKNIINNLAYQVEKKFHLNPSGIDPAAACFGGLIYYRKEFEYLKTIFSLPFTLPTAIKNTLYLVDTGKPAETTAQMVEKVRQEKISFDQFEKVVKTMVRAIEKNDLLSFQNSIKENEILLEKINVVSSKTKKIINDLKKFVAVKVTGAGGCKSNSGYLLVSTNSNKKLKDYCQKKKLFLIKLIPSDQGVEKIL